MLCSFGCFSKDDFHFDTPFTEFNHTVFYLVDDTLLRQKSPSKWNETDLDVSYEQKPHHIYDSKSKSPVGYRCLAGYIALQKRGTLV